MLRALSICLEPFDSKTFWIYYPAQVTRDITLREWLVEETGESIKLNFGSVYKFGVESSSLVFCWYSVERMVDINTHIWCSILIIGSLIQFGNLFYIFEGRGWSCMVSFSNCYYAIKNQNPSLFLILWQNLILMFCAFMQGIRWSKKRVDLKRGSDICRIRSLCYQGLEE